MSTQVRVVGFLVGLAAVFAAALGVGRLVDPDVEPAASHEGSHPSSSAMPEPDLPGGLRVSQGGYTLHLGTTRAAAGQAVPISFTIGRSGDDDPVTEFDVQHEKRLHLIVVRRDLSGFQHVHPTMAADGTWSTTVDLAAGSWRVFADFKPADAEPLVLGTDLEVDGNYRPAAPRPDSKTDQVDGYTVTLDGDIAAGAETMLEARVTREGRPVVLEPYLGALGHLVALRRGDLAYLHVHPEGTTFHTSVPTEGTYDLFLDFKHDGVVHTASFTMTADPTTGAMPDEGDGDEHSH
jgi:hypothetical protein